MAGRLCAAIAKLGRRGVLAALVQNHLDPALQVPEIPQDQAMAVVDPLFGLLPRCSQGLSTILPQPQRPMHGDHHFVQAEMVSLLIAVPLDYPQGCLDRAQVGREKHRLT